MNRKLLILVVVLIAGMGFPRISFGQELLGPLTREEILSAFPAWNEVVAAYQPSAEAVEKLKSITQPVEIRIYLGTWCPDSKAHVSEFFKVLDLVDHPLLSASYIGIPRDKAERAAYYRDENIVKLPTFLIFVGGQEKGRIIEVPQTSIENDLVALLGL